MAKTIQLGEDEVRLGAPASLTIRAEIGMLINTSQVRAFGAALGACWQSPNRPKARLGGNMSDYGKAVIDDLGQRGLLWSQIQEAGQHAWLLCSSGLMREEEVTEHEGNSSGQMEPSALTL